MQLITMPTNECRQMAADEWFYANECRQTLANEWSHANECRQTLAVDRNTGERYEF